MVLKFKRLHENAVAPERMTSESAGYDLALTEDIVFEKGDKSVKLCKTGIAVEIADDSDNNERYALMLYARSSLCKHGLLLANGVGVIDSDYRGEISVPLVNYSDERVKLTAGTRVAQLVIQKILTPDTEETDSLGTTCRGAGGFGSTGV